MIRPVTHARLIVETRTASMIPDLYRILLDPAARTIERRAIRLTSFAVADVLRSTQPIDHQFLPPRTPLNLFPEFIHGEERRPPNVEIKKRLLHTGPFPVGSSHRPKTLPREPRFPTAVRTRREALQSTAWSAMAKLGPHVRRPHNWPWTRSPPFGET